MKNIFLFCIWALSFNFTYGQNQKIISRLEIIDIKTQKRTIVKQFDTRIEAPNWTPDGKSLVFNSGGLIYKIPVQGGEPEQINTGSINGCNNDHILSFDGKLLAISARGPAGSSQVFLLPFTGGEPKLVTQLGPSYLHGISPDSKQLVYSANRNSNSDVYIIQVEGGNEVRLTYAEGLDDGPEFSPDGKYIWFSSVRTGLMQVWRMKVDGSEQTQMTFNEANSWFPHLSPNGKLVVMLIYYKGDVDPGAHPANKNVELHLMPLKSGKSEILTKLFGGQGTLNVNSWSPDSKKIAFVSYELVQ